MNTKNETGSNLNSSYNLEKKHPLDIFKHYYDNGLYFRKIESFILFKKYLLELNELKFEYVWVARLGLCRGLFQQSFSELIFNKDFGKISDLI